MPRLSDSMEEGTILKWLVSEGDEVKRGQPIAEIETDKANMTYEADTDGTVSELVASEGDTLAVGEVIARIGEGDAAPSQPKAEKQDEPEQRTRSRTEPRAEDGAASRATSNEQRATRASSNGGERVKASPVARRMAGEMGVELAQLEGSGPGGRIVKADVEAAAKGDGAAKPKEKPREEAPAPQRGEAGAKGEVEFHELTRLQQTVTRRMAESKATAPDFQLVAEVDMSAAVELRARLKEVADPAPSFNDMVVKAAAVALREHPRVNARLPRRQVRALLARERRHRRGRPGRARRPDDLRRRHEVARPDREGRARADREGARGQDHAAGGVGRHVHRLEPRHVRDRQLLRRHQPAAGGDPHGRRAEEEGGARTSAAGSPRAT